MEPRTAETPFQARFATWTSEQQEVFSAMLDLMEAEAPQVRRVFELCEMTAHRDSWAGYCEVAELLPRIRTSGSHGTYSGCVTPNAVAMAHRRSLAFVARFTPWALEDVA